MVEPTVLVIIGKFSYAEGKGVGKKNKILKKIEYVLIYKQT